MQYTIYIFYKILEYSKNGNFVGSVITYTNQQKNGYESVGLYRSYKISWIGHCNAPINRNLLIVCWFGQAFLVVTLCCQSTRIQAQAIGWIYDLDLKTRWHTMQFSPGREINTLQEATLQEVTQVYLKTNWTPIIDHHQDGQEQALHP